MTNERIQFLLNILKQRKPDSAELEELREFFINPENREIFVSAAEWVSDETVESSAFDENLLQILKTTLNIDKDNVPHQNIASLSDSSAFPSGPLSSTQAASGTAKVRRFNRRFAAIAASVLVLLSVSAYFLVFRNSDDVQNKGGQHLASTEHQPIIEPGKQGAILTLADGREIVLDSLGNGMLSIEPGAEIKLREGQLSYLENNQSADNAPVQWHTLTTPKGRQFQLYLPDGSHVWLNAASSIRFPVTFSENERKVELSGEAFFEIETKYAGNETSNSKKRKIPFIVTTNQQSIEVLGTAFNVNAYENEGVERTTVLEGSVQVAAANAENRLATNSSDIYSNPMVLTRGHQAVVGKLNVELEKRADMEKATAWKDGFFNFDNSSLEEVMRQLERWYDIEVEYEKGIPSIVFGGKMSRNVSLNGLLKLLEGFEIHFRIEEQGRRLIVMP